LRSPVNEIFSGAVEVRKNLEALRPGDGHAEFYDDLKREGVTEYIAWPMEHTLGKRHIVTFSSDRPGGFWRSMSLISGPAAGADAGHRNPAEEHHGADAAADLCRAACKRADPRRRDDARQWGDGRCGDLICDLRDFTTISDHWPRDDVIELLNAYFDAMSEPIEKHGGEILKFMGDGMLAIFPLSNPQACETCCRRSRRRICGHDCAERHNRRRGARCCAMASACTSER
jgi:adenylate cyclase